jgi:hypothetical protein
MSAHTPGPWKAKQTYTRSSLAPRWIVVHNRDGALMHPATIRRGPRLRTWTVEAKAQSAADEMNLRYNESAQQAATNRAVIAKVTDGAL